MKRVLYLLLSLLVLVALITACAGETQSKAAVSLNARSDSDTPFDETNIVLQFGAVSDIHIGRTDGGVKTPQIVRDAYATLQDAALQYNAKGLDAVMASGDLTNNGSTEQVRDFAKLYEEFFDPKEVPLIFSLGNHDVNVGSSYNQGNMDFGQFYDALGDEYRGYERDSDLPAGGIHRVVGDYHFITINPLDEGYRNTLGNSVMYAPETKEWLDETLAKLTRENPDQYVFISTHPLIYGTAYGGNYDNTTTGWYTRELNDILKKYPQAMIFGGHVHFSISSDLSIMQTDFTALQCGAVNYMSSVAEAEYDDDSIGDRNTIHTGYLVQVDGNNNVRVIRLNFGRKAELKYPFVLKAPQADGSHLLDYGWDRGSVGKNEAPVLPKDAISVQDNATGKKDGARVSPRLVFKSGTDDDQIHAYAVTVRNGEGKIVETHRLMADFYKVLQPDQMKSEWMVALTAKYYKGETYEIMLVAADDWGVVSNIVQYTYKP